MSRYRSLMIAGLVATFGLAPLGTVDAAGFADRFQNQRERIEEGVDNGDLTRKEARKLRRQQADLREQREDFAEDGYSKRERKILKRGLNRQNDAISEQRHDSQVR